MCPTCHHPKFHHAKGDVRCLLVSATICLCMTVHLVVTRADVKTWVEEVSKEVEKNDGECVTNQGLLPRTIDRLRGCNVEEWCSTLTEWKIRVDCTEPKQTIMEMFKEKFGSCSPVRVTRQGLESFPTFRWRFVAVFCSCALAVSARFVCTFLHAKLCQTRFPSASCFTVVRCFLFSVSSSTVVWLPRRWVSPFCVVGLLLW